MTMSNESKTRRISSCRTPDKLILDVGGEGRYAAAWNVNPSRTITLGSRRGSLIPRHVPGRAEDIPFSDESADVIIAERTPLLPAGLRELRRVIKPGGLILLRHAITPCGDPHRIAIQVFVGAQERRQYLKHLALQETSFIMPRRSPRNADLLRPA